MDRECKPIQMATRGKQGSALHLNPDSPKSTILIMIEPKTNDSITTKEVLTSDEVSRYMGISLSYLYKLTMLHKIPHYKPLGKMCYFNRVEVEQWLQSNRVATDEELNERATAYCMKGGEL